MASDTWESRELPILEALAALEEESSSTFPNVNDDDLGGRAGIDGPAFARSMRSLADAGYLRGSDASDMAAWGMISIELLSRGRRAIGQWPSEDPADAFLRALDRAIAVESDDDKRSILERLRENAAEIGRSVLSGLIVVASEGVLR